MVGAEPGAWAWLPPLVGAIGGADFPEIFQASLHQGFGVDHVVVFTFDPHARAGTLATVGRIGAGLAARLARDYAVAGWFERDPNLPAIRAAGPVPAALHTPLARRPYALDYRRRFFEAADIVDKFAFSVRAPDGCILYANFHRLADSGPFDAAGRAALLQHGGVLAAALLRHRQLITASRRLEPVGSAFAALTAREREVCAGILNGLTSDGIALALGVSRNTVLTLRRRAYARLGISSQGELVRLALSAG
jgi:DNA-binding CsgD family transcriptional regulator